MDNVLSIVNIKKEWPIPGQSPLQVLKGIHLSIKKGTSAAIIGPSGSGKSTLLSILAGLDSPTSGSLEVMGVDIAKMNESELAVFRGKNLGIVFQQFHLMPSLNALENVALPLDIAHIQNSKDLAKNALEAVGLSARMHHLPKELSGGESQRVAIARAIVTNPALLLADEPSGNLDSETGEQITHLLFEIAKKNKMTMVLVTHNPELAARCDEKYLMTRGELSRV